jgi:hypothetical protein
MSISLPVKKKKTPAYQQKKKDFTIIYITEIFPFLYDVTADLTSRKARIGKVRLATRKTRFRLAAKPLPTAARNKSINDSIQPGGKGHTNVKFAH